MELTGGGLPQEVRDATRSCKSWIRFPEPEFDLAPKQGHSLLLRVSVPRSMSGGYYALIWCHGRPTSSSQSSGTSEGVSAGIRLSYRVMAVLMLTVPGADVRAIVEPGQPFFGRKKDQDKWSLVTPIRNIGTLHDRIRGEVEIRSADGQPVSKGPLEAGQGFLLPGYVRLFEHALPSNLPDGLYDMATRVVRVGTNQYKAKEYPFFIKNGTPELGEASQVMKRSIESESAGFLVMPDLLAVNQTPGGRRGQAVEIRNLTKETLKVRATAMEWTRSAEGENLVSKDEPPHGRSGRELLVLKSPEIELRPLAKRRVSLMVSIPRDASGEYYSAVTFDRDDLDLSKDPAQLARRSVLLRIQAQGTGTPSVEITDFSATRLPNGAVEFVTRFKNTGNLGVFPDVSVSIQNESGSSIGKETNPEAQSSLVQAGGECEIKTLWNQVLDPGTYTGVLTLRYDPNTPPLSSRTQFEVVAPGQANPVEAPNPEQEG